MNENLTNIECHLETLYFTMAFNNKELEQYSVKYGDREIAIHTVYDKSIKSWRIVIWSGKPNLKIFKYDIKISDFYLNSNVEANNRLCRRFKDDKYYFELDINKCFIIKSAYINSHRSYLKKFEELSDGTIMFSKKYIESLKGYNLKCNLCGQLMPSSYGRVIDIGKNYNGQAPDIKYFIGHYYKQVPYSEMYTITWYNNAEYEEELKEHFDWDSFEDKWKDNPNYWRSPEGKVSKFNHAPVIGSYERVVSAYIKDTPKEGTIACPCCGTFADANQIIPASKGIMLKIEDCFCK